MLTLRATAAARTAAAPARLQRPAAARPVAALAARRSEGVRGAVALRAPAAAVVAQRQPRQQLEVVNGKAKVGKAMKTKKAAAKRFRVTAGGKVERRHAMKGHLLGHKSSKRKRFLSTEAIVERADIQNVRNCLPYARIK